MSDHVVYDAGALIAADKNKRSFLAAHDIRLRAGIVPLLPAPVLSQAWIPGSRHYGLHHVINGCRVVPFTEHHARAVAVLCRAADRPDVVDGFVVVTAIDYNHAPIITSDSSDIGALVAASDTGVRVTIHKP